MEERAQGGDKCEAVARVHSGKYLENVGYPYAGAVSVLVLRGGRGRRQEAPRAGEGRQGLGMQPGGREAAGAKCRRKSTLFWGRTRDAMRWREKNIHFPSAQACWHLQSMGTNRGAGPPGGQSCFRAMTEEDEAEPGLGPGMWSPPLTHLHKHPLNLNITLKKLVLFQRKDKEEVKALQEQGWKARLNNSAQRLLQGKHRRDPRPQSPQSTPPTQTGTVQPCGHYSREHG